MYQPLHRYWMISTLTIRSSWSSSRTLLPHISSNLYIHRNNNRRMTIAKVITAILSLLRPGRSPVTPLLRDSRDGSSIVLESQSVKKRAASITESLSNSLRIYSAIFIAWKVNFVRE